MPTVPEDQLAPCPFCGGKAFYVRVGTARVSCIIACDDCNCRLETGEVWDCGKRWNTRWSPDRAIAERAT